MKTFSEFILEGEDKVHPKAVHYSYDKESKKNIVKAVGQHAAKHLNIGDELKSSDIDDLSNAGFKIKQVK